jgi:hypothetical protein
MWANTLWPFSSSTRNIAFGSDSTIVPSNTMASSDFARGILLDTNKAFCPAQRISFNDLRTDRLAMLSGPDAIPNGGIRHIFGVLCYRLTAMRGGRALDANALVGPPIGGPRWRR